MSKINTAPPGLYLDLRGRRGGKGKGRHGKDTWKGEEGRKMGIAHPLFSA